MIVLAALVVAPSTSAHRRPTAREAAAIGHAAHHSTLTSAVPCFHVRRVLVSTAGPWAKATLAPCNPQQDQTAIGVFERRRGKWVLRDVLCCGTGCSVRPPSAVRHDLGLRCR